MFVFADRFLGVLLCMFFIGIRLNSGRAFSEFSHIFRRFFTFTQIKVLLMLIVSFLREGISFFCQKLKFLNLLDFSQPIFLARFKSIFRQHFQLFLIILIQFLLRFNVPHNRRFRFTHNIRSHLAVIKLIIREICLIMIRRRGMILTNKCAFRL